MAVIIPSAPAWPLSPGASHTFASLLALPDDWRVWLRLPFPEFAAQPEFLVLASDRRVAFLSGTDLRPVDLASLDQLSFLTGAPSAQVDRFHQAIRPLQNYRPAFPDPPPILRLLVCTALKPGQIPTEQFLRLAPGLAVVSRDTVVNALPVLMQSHPPLRLDQVAALRAQFTPEAVVPVAFAARNATPARTDRSPSPPPSLLLDFDQEAWLKRDLAIPPEVNSTGDAPTTLITGVAGCGKSLVLLYRAILERKLQPGKPLLFLTHNEALAVDLTNRAQLLARVHRAPPLVVQTYYKWCGSWARRIWTQAVAYEEQETALRQALGPLDADQIRFLRDEFSWLQDYPITTETEYLATHRRGRTFPLRREQRPAIFQQFLRYRQYLRDQQKTDWSGLALRIHDAVTAGTLRPPQYERVFVDEAQFFARTWLLVIRAAIEPTVGKIFIAADPTQGFLQRRQSWSEFGFDIRGRPTRLRRAYRSTRATLRFARDFYVSRAAPEETELNLPEQAELNAAPAGAWPLVISQPNQQDEVGALIQALRPLQEKNASLGHVLVLHASGRRVRGLIELLGRALPTVRVVPAKAATGSDQLRVCSVEGATGLEAPFVFILGLREMFEAEASPLLSAENRRQLVEEHSKLAYMAFTRAGVRLFLLWSGRQAPPFPSPPMEPPAATP